MAAHSEREHAAGLPWWFQPFSVVAVLSAFAVYAVWAVFFGSADIRYGPYLSPFYSPFISIPGLAWLSPAIFVAWVPLGFRATCYYYRKAYYRSFFGDPVGCAKPEYFKRPGYTGETRFPFTAQHLHRYFLYLSIIVWFFLAYDAIRAFFFDDGFGIGIGTLVLVLNAVFLGLYTFSCHSFRHLVGGSVDCFDCVFAGGPRQSAWKRVSRLNQYHGVFAWISLVWVGFADLYVRLVAAGVWHDFRFF